MYRLRLIALLVICSLLQITTAQVQGEAAQVKYVIDGDTVVLRDNRHVRLLGVNSPEIARKKRRAEPGGNAAKIWLTKQLQGQTIRLVADHEKVDKYGRSLFYLLGEQGNLINEQLLAKGHATLNIYPPNLKYLPQLQAAQRRAEKKELGIWALPAYQPVKLAKLDSKRKGWQRVIVTVEAIKQSRKVVRLMLGDDAELRIAKKNLRYFPKLEGYLHQKLEVRGWPLWHKGKVSIFVRHPSALILLE